MSEILCMRIKQRGEIMAKYISNMDELEKALMPTMQKMVDEITTRVYETLNYFLQKYYDSYDPVVYQRQKDFLYSAVKVEPKIVRNKVVAYVYIDYESMDNYYNASGYQVVKWANQGLHGGLDVGSNTPYVWDDTIDETINNGKLLKLAAEYLRTQGFSVSIR